MGFFFFRLTSGENSEKKPHPLSRFFKTGAFPYYWQKKKLGMGFFFQLASAQNVKKNLTPLRFSTRNPCSFSVYRIPSVGHVLCCFFCILKSSVCLILAVINCCRVCLFLVMFHRDWGTWLAIEFLYKVLSYPVDGLIPRTMQIFRHRCVPCARTTQF